MVRGEAMKFEELDKFSSGMSEKRGAVILFEVDGDKLERVAEYHGEAEADISASALATHMRGDYIVKTDKRLTRYKG